MLKVIQEYVLGEYDPDATDAYHDNHTSESADEDHVKDTSKRYDTKFGKKDTNNIWKQNSDEYLLFLCQLQKAPGIY